MLTGDEEQMEVFQERIKYYQRREKELDQKYDRSLQELESLRQENQTLKTTMESLQKELSASNLYSQELNSEITLLRSQNIQLRDQVDKSTKEETIQLTKKLEEVTFDAGWKVNPLAGLRTGILNLGYLLEQQETAGQGGMLHFQRISKVQPLVEDQIVGPLMVIVSDHRLRVTGWISGLFATHVHFWNLLEELPELKDVVAPLRTKIVPLLGSAYSLLQQKPNGKTGGSSSFLLSSTISSVLPLGDEALDSLVRAFWKVAINEKLLVKTFDLLVSEQNDLLEKYFDKASLMHNVTLRLKLRKLLVLLESIPMFADVTAHIVMKQQPTTVTATVTATKL
jgi:hypothetical protein